MPDLSQPHIGLHCCVSAIPTSAACDWRVRRQRDPSSPGRNALARTSRRQVRDGRWPSRCDEHAIRPLVGPPHHSWRL